MYRSVRRSDLELLQKTCSTRSVPGARETVPPWSSSPRAMDADAAGESPTRTARARAVARMPNRFMLLPPKINAG